MSVAELNSWMVFDAIEPIGFARDDFRAAHMARWSAAPHMKEVPALKDFMPFGDERFDQADEEVDEEFSLGSWVEAASRKGIAVKTEGSD